MIITISGYPGSGKSTLAKSLAKALGFRHHNAGEMIRQIMNDKGISLLEGHKVMDAEPEIDLELDRKTEELGKKEDNFVIEGRIAWHFIPKSVKVFVKIDLNEAGKRVYEDSRLGKKERDCEMENISLKHTVENMKKRIEMNKQRYMKLYKIDYFDEKNYDIVVDTTKNGAEETKQKVLNQIKQYGIK